MSRLIFLFAIAALIYLLIKSYSKKIPENKTEEKQAMTEDMVRCLQCGVHLPAGESIKDGERIFCSHAHRDAYRK